MDTAFMPQEVGALVDEISGFHSSGLARTHD